MRLWVVEYSLERPEVNKGGPVVVQDRADIAIGAHPSVDDHREHVPVGVSSSLRGIREGQG